MLNPLVQHYSRVPHSDPNEQERLVDLERLGPEFNVHLGTAHSCSDFKESRVGEFVHYEIVDKFVMLGGLTSKLMTYRAAFRPLYDMSSNSAPGAAGRESIGLETISDPGSGVSLLGKWSVGEDDRKPGFLVLTEQVKVHCNVFMGWYVRSQLEQAHAQLHKEFGRFFCERMVEEDPMKGHIAKSGRTWKETEVQLQREELRRSASGGTGSTPISRVGTEDSKKDRPITQSDTW